MTVKIKPGTSPNTEYEYGNDMIAKQMYSEKSSAAVWRTLETGHQGRTYAIKGCTAVGQSRFLN